MQPKLEDAGVKSVRAQLFHADPYEGLDLTHATVDLAGWGSEDPNFAAMLAQYRPARIIEVGTWKGASAVHMLREAAKINLAPEMICIDTWLGALEFWTDQADPERYIALRVEQGYPHVFYDFLANVQQTGFAAQVTPFPNTSINAARWLALRDVCAELIYIDASHELDDVFADLTAYYSLLRPGGAMFGDDYDEYWPDLRRAVDAFSQANGLPLEIRGRQWIIRHAAAKEVRPLTSYYTDAVARARPAVIDREDPSDRKGRTWQALRIAQDQLEARDVELAQLRRQVQEAEGRAHRATDEAAQLRRSQQVAAGGGPAGAVARRLRRAVRAVGAVARGGQS